MFLFVFAADDFGHVRQALKADVAGSIELGSAGDRHWCFGGWNYDFGCLRAGSDGQGKQKQNYGREAERCHVWSPLISRERYGAIWDVREVEK